jgi:hypothetical protein
MSMKTNTYRVHGKLCLDRPTVGDRLHWALYRFEVAVHLKINPNTSLYKKCYRTENRLHFE